MTSAELLKTMDSKAEEFEFPVLDNASWDYAGGRIRAFRRGAEVAVVFELLVFQPGSHQFLTDVYAYGDLLRHPGGYVTSWTLLSEVPSHPLFDEDGEWRRDVPVRRVSVNGITVVANRQGVTEVSAEGEIGVQLSWGDDAAEGDFVLALARELGMRMLVPEGKLLEAVPELAGAEEVARLSRWDHPDVAAGALPSSSRAVAGLAALLTREADDLPRDPLRDNSDRRFWVAREES